jgi:lysozyme family protein
MHTFEALRMEYKALWQRMEISQRATNKVDVAARKLLLSKHRYRAVAAKTGVPWFLIAVLHERESSADFSAHLHNGDPLELRTYHVPAGRPVNGAPPFTWEESAIDALELKNLHRIGAWPIERIAYECERYNGWGYRHHSTPSAYLWSFSNIYQGGKYVADGVWSAAALDRQCGTMPLLKRMAEIDRSIALFPRPPPITDEVPPNQKPLSPPLARTKNLGWGAAIVAAIGAAAQSIGNNPALTFGVVIVAAVLALYLVHRCKKEK